MPEKNAVLEARLIESSVMDDDDAFDNISHNFNSRWRKCNVANLYYKRINITIDVFFLSFDFMITKQMLLIRNVDHVNYELSNLKKKLKNEPQWLTLQN